MKDFIKRIGERSVICPQPQQWNRLWEMLPSKVRAGSGWNPPLPLILDGWWYSNDGQKKARFLSHLDWADAHGVSNEVVDFLESLTPDDWHTEEGHE